MGPDYTSGTIYLNFPIELLKDVFFNPVASMNNIMDYSIYKHCIKYYPKSLTVATMKQSASDLGIRLGDPIRSIDNALALIKKIETNGPTVGVSKDTIFDFYKNTKTEFQIASFCAFCAFKSIIGKKRSCKTNKGLVHARMFGFRSVKDLPKKLSKIQAKYLNRYHFDKVKTELELNWHLKLFAHHCRGFYVSFEVDHLELAKLCVKNNKNNKKNNLKQVKNGALKTALSEFNSTAHLGANTVQMHPRYTAASTAP